MKALGFVRANKRVLLPSFSFVEIHLPPQGGIATRREASLHKGKAKVSEENAKNRTRHTYNISYNI